MLVKGAPVEQLDQMATWSSQVSLQNKVNVLSKILNRKHEACPHIGEVGRVTDS